MHFIIAYGLIVALAAFVSGASGAEIVKGFVFTVLTLIAVAVAALLVVVLVLAYHDALAVLAGVALFSALPIIGVVELVKGLKTGALVKWLRTARPGLGLLLYFAAPTMLACVSFIRALAHGAVDEGAGGAMLILGLPAVVILGLRRRRPAQQRELTARP